MSLNQSRKCLPFLKQSFRSILVRNFSIDGDPSTEKKMQLARMEYEMFKQEKTHPVPTVMNEQQFKTLSECRTTDAKLAYLQSLFKKEHTMRNKLARDVERRELAKEYQQDKVAKMNENNHLNYCLWRNSMLIKLTKQTINRAQNAKLIPSYSLNDNLIFDFGFEEVMRPHEMAMLSRQMVEAYSVNRRSPNPFALKYYNLDRSSAMFRVLSKFDPSLKSDYITKPVPVIRESYLDDVPKDKLVMLTADSREKLVSFDPDITYIIPAYLLTGSMRPYALAEAKKKGIRHACFPFDDYLKWSVGAKYLPMNQIMGILLEMKHTGDWQRAFDRNVSWRKVGAEDRERRRTLYPELDACKNNIRAN